MRYIFPKSIDISNFSVIETKEIFKIGYTNENIDIYGIIIKLEDISIQKKLNNFEIKLKNYDELSKYDDFLNDKVPNYKKITNPDKCIVIKNNPKIKEYHDKGTNDIYINIGYVKKMGFLNVPMINIL